MVILAGITLKSSFYGGVTVFRSTHVGGGFSRRRLSIYMAVWSGGVEDVAGSSDWVAAVTRHQHLIGVFLFVCFWRLTWQRRLFVTGKWTGEMGGRLVWMGGRRLIILMEREMTKWVNKGFIRVVGTFNEWVNSQYALFI